MKLVTEYKTAEPAAIMLPLFTHCLETNILCEYHSFQFRRSFEQFVVLLCQLGEILDFR